MVDQRVREVGSHLFTILPPIIFYIVVAAFCRDAPYFDDYFSVLEPAITVRTDPSLATILETLVSQNNQHRIITTHIAAFTYMAIFGDISFWVLNFLGNGLLILAAFSIYRSIRIAGSGRADSVGSSTVLIVISCLLFNFSFFRLLSFPMAAVSVVGVYSFAIFGFYLVFRGHLLFGLVALAACAASQANGLIGIPLAALFLAMQRQWKGAMIAAAVALIVVGLYFSHYDFHATMSPLIDKFKPDDNAASTPIWTRLAYFLVQVGSLTTLNNRSMNLPVSLLAVPALTGIALLGIHLWLLARGHLTQRPAISAFLLFLLAAMAALSVVRIGDDFNEWVPVRYKLGSCLYAACTLGLVAEVLRHKGLVGQWFGQSLRMGAIAFWLASFVFLVPHINHFRSFTKPLTTEKWYTEQQAQAAAWVLAEAERLGLYAWKER